ncbi:MAG TPA: hypothetical protein VMG34_06525 [Bacteroidota bacterium]|nr:hypothetical protein [Bacteroidota bacterium]
MTSHRYEYGGAFAHSGLPHVRDRASEVRDNLHPHGRCLPFLLFLYLLNGNHDPRKVQGLNLVLALFSFAGSLLLGWNLFLLGMAFVGVAIVNELNLWCIRRFTDFTLPSGPCDVLAEIQRWSER